MSSVLWTPPFDVAALFHRPFSFDSIFLQLLTTLLAVGASVSVLPPVLRKVLPDKVVDLPVSKPLDAALAKAFPKVTSPWFTTSQKIN